MKKAFLWLFLLAGSFFSQEEARLLRFPAIHGDRIAFVYAGDLYTVASQGGVARRLTSHLVLSRFRVFRLTAPFWHSPANMTATPKSTSSPPKAETPGD